MILPFDASYTPFAATFLLVFALVFGLLSVSKLLDKRVNALLALAIALFSIFYTPLVVGLQEFMPIAAIFLIIVFFIVFLKKVFGGEKGHAADLLPIVVVLALLLLVLTTIGAGQFVISWLSSFGFAPTDALFFVGLIIVLIIFVAVYYHKGWPASKE